MVLTTVNPRLPKHWWRLIALISLVYSAEAAIHTSLSSSQKRGSGLSSACLLILPFIYDDQDNISKGNVTLDWDFSIFSSFHVFSCSNFYIYILCSHKIETLPSACFFWGCMNTETGLSDYTYWALFVLYYCFQNPLNHITVVRDISVYLEMFSALCSS